MEDAHAAVLDLQPDDNSNARQPSAPDKRLAYFGVYDGHGGEKVAQFAGENIHKIVAKQEAFSKGDIEQALKDGFLATDRAILNGMLQNEDRFDLYMLRHRRCEVRGRGIRMYRICGDHFER